MHFQKWNSSRFSKICCAILSLLLTGLAPRTARADTSINYTLESAGQVSMAIYDGQGRLLRTLLSGQSLKAGPHAATWDGLDYLGQPVPPGEYQWRLIYGPGVTAEYLMSIGTSFGINHVPGQHGGPQAVAVADDSVYMTASVEGSPSYAKWTLDGTYQWANWGLGAGISTVDLAADQGVFYVLTSTGTCTLFSAKNGAAIKSWNQSRVVKTIPGVEATTDASRTLSVELNPGSYFLNVHAGGSGRSNPALTCSFNGHEFGIPAVSDMVPMQTTSGPEVYRSLSPLSVPDGKIAITFKSTSPGVAWAIPSIDVMAIPARIDAHGSEAIVSYSGAAGLSWIDPATGKSTADADVPCPQDVAVAGPGEAVAIQDQKLVLIKRGSAPVVLASDLVSAYRVTVDLSTGDIFVVETGASQQIRKFSHDGKPKARFGRAGGRSFGPYHAEDFRDVSDIAADGHGGFVITEWFSAPRRTAHFDSDGKLIKEWYGGQQFYTFAVPEPGNPNLVWMDSQWGWLMQVEVDYQKRTWKPVATYPWANHLDGSLFSTGKMVGRMFPFRADLNRSGKKSLYMWFQGSGTLVRVDEEKGEMFPIAALGRVIPWNRWNWPTVPLSDINPAYLAAVRALGVKVEKTKDIEAYMGYGFADLNGNGQADDPSKFRIYKSPGSQGFSENFLTIWMDTKDFRLYGCPDGVGGVGFITKLPVGRTAAGWPIWDWAAPTESGPKLPFTYGGSRAIRTDDQGNVYELAAGGGDGFSSGLDTFHSHGASWPGTLTDRTRIIKTSPDGKIMFAVGSHAILANHPPGQMHLPVHVAGFAKGCLGVADYFRDPCHFWTQDGLYVGELLDHRFNDGLPDKVYTWWEVKQGGGDNQDNQSLFQYDMAEGGSLVELPSGEVVFMGAGWNNCPTYRVHGLDQFKRVQGPIHVDAAVSAIPRTGTGLTSVYTAEHFAVPTKSVDEADAKPTSDDLDADLSGGARTLSTPEARRAAALWFSKPRDRWNHYWPSGLVLGDGFKARYTGFVTPLFSEDYTFSAYVTGSVRLWIDGQLVIDQPQGGKQQKYVSKPIPMVSGKKTPIVVEYTSGGADSELHINWDSLSQPVEHIPQSVLSPAESNLKVNAR